MIKRLKPILFLVLAGLAALIAGAVIGVYVTSELRLNRTYQIDVAPLSIPTDTASIVRGQHLFTSIGGCASCHRDNLAGGDFIDVPPFNLRAPNLTAGVGGVGMHYTDADWVRAIRYGVRPNGKTLMFMPARSFGTFSDADLGAIIAYIKSVPPVDQQIAPSEMRVLGRLLITLNEYQLPAETVDHTARPAPAPLPARTATYGGYLARVAKCMDCHAENMSGQVYLEGEPAAPNLTPGGELATWSEADFIRTLRTGVNPTGRSIDGMPWQEYSGMTDDELGALFHYLGSLPPLPYNSK